MVYEINLGYRRAKQEEHDESRGFNTGSAVQINSRDHVVNAGTPRKSDGQVRPESILSRPGHRQDIPDQRARVMARISIDQVR